MNREFLRFDWKKGKKVFVSLFCLLGLLFFLLATGLFPRIRFSYFNGNGQPFLNFRVTNVFSLFELWLPLFFSFGLLYLNAADLRNEEREFLTTLPFSTEKTLIGRTLLYSLIAMAISLPFYWLAYRFLCRQSESLSELYLLSALFSTWVNILFFTGIGTLLLHFTKYFGLTISVIFFLNFLDYGNRSRFSGAKTFFPLCFFNRSIDAAFFQNRIGYLLLGFFCFSLPSFYVFFKHGRSSE